MDFEALLSETRAYGWTKLRRGAGGSCVFFDFSSGKDDFFLLGQPAKVPAHGCGSVSVRRQVQRRQRSGRKMVLRFAN